MSNYTIDNIETLSFLEGVRKRIAMYLGSADMNGVYNSIQEIISNSVDEFYMGYGSKIEVSLGKDNLITIVDSGRGIPFGTKDDGSNVLVDIFTKPHTGGKFNDKVYQNVAGLNGIGAKATCLSSLKFRVGVWRDGKYAQATFEKGVLVKYEEHPAKGSEIEKTGTQIQFVPDPEVFNLEPISIEFDILCDKCKNLSYLTKGLTFEVGNFIDAPVIKKYCATNGLVDLVLEKAEKPVHPTPLYYQFEEDGNKIEIAALWTKKAEQAYVFTNGLYNSEGGTSLTGLRSSITRNINKILDITLSGELARTGLVYAISCTIPNPSFANQTKTKINNPELRSLADKGFKEAMTIFAQKHPDEVIKIQEFLTKEDKAEKAAARARQAIMNQVKKETEAKFKKVILADKLKDCIHHGEESMLLICEGDSALGSLAVARPLETVALLPIRGKIINYLRHDIEKVLNNQEVSDIILTLGCGIHDRYNAKRLRYGKVGIAVDADADGYNILCLLATLFQGIMPEFIVQKRLHWLRAPLFKIDYGSIIRYAFTDAELVQIQKKYGVGKSVSRIKGLGELNSEDVRDSMFGENQRLECLTINNVLEDFSQLQLLMGEEVAARRDFIFNNIDFSKLEE